MPQQELFLEREILGGKVQVVKIYDPVFACEVYEDMDQIAHGQLAESLSEHDDATGLGDDLWEDVLESAREDWNLFSFFVVQSLERPGPKNLFISAFRREVRGRAIGRTVRADLGTSVFF